MFISYIHFLGLSHVGMFGQFISSVTVKKYGTPICIEEDPSQLQLLGVPT